jgi:Phage tail tube protein, GTA-gp10
MITTQLELLFADGTYIFDLKLPQMDELQEKRGVGIFELYGRVVRGRYLYEDIAVADTLSGVAYDKDLFETIRLGLIGGGRGIVDDKEIEVTPLTARVLVERYCHPAPLKESWQIAAAVLAARIEGYQSPKKDEPVEEPATEEKPKPRSTSKKS